MQKIIEKNLQIRSKSKIFVEFSFNKFRRLFSFSSYCYLYRIRTNLKYCAILYSNIFEIYTQMQSYTCLKNNID